jgi:type II secretory pathway pseudopilin PulG
MRWMQRLRGRPHEGGFGLVETLVAVTILAIALVLSIQPIMASLNRIDASQDLSVAEKLAQSEIDSVLALNYDDVGLPGRTPSGVLTESRTVSVGSQSYVIEDEVDYAGSLTGMDIIDQGGDGVPGVWDPGVNYKVVTVTVTPAAPGAEPVTMSAIISPSRIGALDGVASVRVTIAAYEPFAPSGRQLPTVTLHSPPQADIRSGSHAQIQVFPAITPTTWTALVDASSGWAIHPDDVLAGQNVVQALVGAVGEAAFRVYQPSTLVVTVLSADTGQPVSGFQVTLLDMASGDSTTYGAGVGTLTNLVPDAYKVTVAASGYLTFDSDTTNIPAGYPDLVQQMTVNLAPVPATTTTTTAPGATTTTTSPGGGGTPTYYSVTFSVTDNGGRAEAGATVSVSQPTQGVVSGTTDQYGRVTLSLEGGSCTATASTPWGHGPATATFNSASTSVVTLHLTRPSGTGTGVLTGSGHNFELVYRHDSSSPWVPMPPNAQNQASFVDIPTTYLVAERCLSSGYIVGQKTLTIRSDRDQFTSIWGSCW